MAFPQVIRLGISAFPARLAYGMIGLGIFFKTEQETGSVAAAGFAIGLNSLAGAATAGLRGSVMDRFGQKWPIRILVPMYSGLILLLNTMETRQSILITAFVLGITAPPINLSVRPLWKDIVPDSYLRTAYAFDSSMMSSTTVLGPVVITALSLSSRPGLGLGTTAALMFTGGIALSLTPASRDWIPEKKIKGQQRLWRDRAIQLLMFEGCFIGFGWGVFDVAVPAFATQEGVCLPIAFTYPDWTMALVGASIGFLGGAVQVFYFEVLEAVRPKGSQTASLGWIWSVEGSFMAVGAAVGGVVSEVLSPRIGLAMLPIMICIGLIILSIGRGRLSAANDIPTDEEDLQAMKDISNVVK